MEMTGHTHLRTHARRQQLFFCTRAPPTPPRPQPQASVPLFRRHAVPSFSRGVRGSTGGLPNTPRPTTSSTTQMADYISPPLPDMSKLVSMPGPTAIVIGRLSPNEDIFRWRRPHPVLETAPKNVSSSRPVATILQQPAHNIRCFSAQWWSVLSYPAPQHGGAARPPARVPAAVSIATTENLLPVIAVGGRGVMMSSSSSAAAFLRPLHNTSHHPSSSSPLAMDKEVGGHARATPVRERAALYLARSSAAAAATSPPNKVAAPPVLLHLPTAAAVQSAQAAATTDAAVHRPIPSTKRHEIPHQAAASVLLRMSVMSVRLTLFRTSSPTRRFDGDAGIQLAAREPRPPLSPPQCGGQTKTSSTAAAAVARPEGSCPRCRKFIFMPERVMGPGGQWHKSCLTCAQCGKSLNSGSLADHAGEAYCCPCHERAFGRMGFRSGSATLAF